MTKMGNYGRRLRRSACKSHTAAALLKEGVSKGMRSEGRGGLGTASASARATSRNGLPIGDESQRNTRIHQSRSYYSGEDIGSPDTQTTSIIVPQDVPLRTKFP